MIAATLTTVTVLGLCFVIVGTDHLGVYLYGVLPQTNTALGGERIDNLATRMLLRTVFGPGVIAQVSKAAFQLLLLSSVLLRIRQRRVPADLAVSIGVTLLLLLTPVVWAHYYVLLALPWLVTLAGSPKNKLPWGGVAWCAGAIPSFVYLAPAPLVVAVQAIPLLGVGMLLYLQLAAPIPDTSARTRKT